MPQLDEDKLYKRRSKRVMLVIGLLFLAMLAWVWYASVSMEGPGYHSM